MILKGVLLLFGNRPLSYVSGFYLWQHVLVCDTDEQPVMVWLHPRSEITGKGLIFLTLVFSKMWT